MKIPFLLGFLSSVGLHAGIFAFSYALFSSSLQIPESDIRQFQSFSSDTLVFDVSISDNGFADIKGASTTGVNAGVNKQLRVVSKISDIDAGNSGSLQDDSDIQGSPIEGTKLGISPEYPRLARERGEQGRAIYEVYVNQDSEVESVRLINSSGSRILDNSGAQALSNAYLDDYRGFKRSIALTYKLK